MQKYSQLVREIEAKARNKGIPLDGTFEITSRCNFKCGFCYMCDRSDKVEIYTEKTTDEWLDMIKQAVDMGMLFCSFTGGDPFTREDFEEIYCKAYDMGLRTSILTNGSLIGKKEIAYFSKRIPNMISITLYGASEESYDTVSGNRKNFYCVMDSIDELHSAGIPFELKALSLRPLIPEYQAMNDIITKYNCVSRFDPFLGARRDDHCQSQIDWRVPLSDIQKARNSFFIGQKKSELNNNSKEKDTDNAARDITGIRCGAGKSGFTITYDGRMLGCMLLTCFVAYPFKDGFEFSWIQLKDMIRSAEVCEECKQCLDYSNCFKCPAQRFLETGTITECSSYLHELARLNC